MRSGSSLAPCGIQCLNDGTECIGASCRAPFDPVPPGFRGCESADERSWPMSTSTLSPPVVRAPDGSRGAEGAVDSLYVISTHKVRDRSGTPPYRWVPYGLEH